MEYTCFPSSQPGENPFPLQSPGGSYDSVAGTTGKGKWKKSSSFPSVLTCFLSFLIALSSPQLVSGKASWDGVVVTQADYQSLRAIKHDLVDPFGILRSWNDSGLGACSGGWAGIKCVKGQVIAIQLPWKGLGGRISEKIGQLRALRKLSLHDNVLSGPVPWSLGFLPFLRGVYLFNNRLSGSIPPSVGNCPVLQTLDLSNNALSGTIPPGLANPTRLYRLNLSFNSFSGQIPLTLTRSRSLTILALEHNNLSGQVPDTWAALERNGEGSSSYQLQILTLDHNLLTGTIPASLSSLPLLEQISLSHNLISGVIPEDLGTLTKLRMIDLSYNSLSGSITEGMDRMQNLSVLNLKNNQLSGHIPSTMGNISGLTLLDLAENNFTGEIPASLSQLAYLISFNVSYNHLAGPVPSVLSRKFNSSSFMGNLQLCGYSISTPCPSPQPLILSPPPKHHHRKLSLKDIILISVGVLLVVLLVLFCILLGCLLKKRAALKRKNRKTGAVSAGGKSQKVASPVAGSEVQSGGEMGGKLVHFNGPFLFTADDLLCATAEIMGKSTYGTAYKATLEDGNVVAVKRLREKTTKGVREFEAEAAALGKIRHPNLLALRAYYLGPKGEKLLVFDYMPKGSLSSFLHARGPETTVTWGTRMSIAMGIARGLAHLHDKENIIHGNLTSSSVLLDDSTNALIADYGLTRLMTVAASTNVIATAGSLGYRAPEFSKLKNASTKTDVYSLGVIILELLTGKSPGEPTNGVELPQWVASIVKEEWTNEVFDLELIGEVTSASDELLNTLKLALHCVDPSPAARPEAQQVLQQLESIKPDAAAGSSVDDGAKAPETTE